MKKKNLSAALLVAVATCLVSCAGSGLYNMSEDWCARHVEAGAARCPENSQAQRTALIPPSNAAPKPPSP